MSEHGRPHATCGEIIWGIVCLLIIGKLLLLVAPFIILIMAALAGS